MREHLSLGKVIVIAVLFSPLAFLALVKVEAVPKDRFWPAVALLSLGISLALIIVLAVVQRSAANSFLAFLFPMRATGTANTWSSSRALSLAAVGRIEDATAEFERLRTVAPNDGILLRQIAEFHLNSGNAQRSAEVLAQLRALPNCTVSDELYASQRLIDLYLGPLERQDRALVEMRRLADRFPDTPDGKGALAELRRRKLINEHLDHG